MQFPGPPTSSDDPQGGTALLSEAEAVPQARKQATRVNVLLEQGKYREAFVEASNLRRFLAERCLPTPRMAEYLANAEKILRRLTDRGYGPSPVTAPQSPPTWEVDSRKWRHAAPLLAAMVLLVIVVAVGSRLMQGRTSTPAGSFHLPSQPSVSEGDPSGGWCADVRQPQQGWMLSWTYQEAPAASAEEAAGAWLREKARLWRVAPGCESIEFHDAPPAPLTQAHGSLRATLSLLNPDPVCGRSIAWYCGVEHRLVAFFAWGPSEADVDGIVESLNPGMSGCHHNAVIASPLPLPRLDVPPIFRRSSHDARWEVLEKGTDASEEIRISRGEVPPLPARIGPDSHSFYSGLPSVSWLHPQWRRDAGTQAPHPLYRATGLSNDPRCHVAAGAYRRWEALAWYCPTAQKAYTLVWLGPQERPGASKAAGGHGAHPAFLEAWKCIEGCDGEPATP